MLLVTKADPLGLIAFGYLEILPNEDDGGRVVPGMM